MKTTEKIKKDKLLQSLKKMPTPKQLQDIANERGKDTSFQYEYCDIARIYSWGFQHGAEYIQEIVKNNEK